MEDFSKESQFGSTRIADTNYHVIEGSVITVVTAATFTKLREEGIPADSGSGTAQVINVVLSGTAGVLKVTGNGYTAYVTFNTDLTTTASDFVTANSTAFATFGITLTSSTNTLIFTAATAGLPINVTTSKVGLGGDLNGIPVTTTANVTTPLLLHGLSGATVAGEQIHAKTKFTGVQLSGGVIQVR